MIDAAVQSPYEFVATDAVMVDDPLLFAVRLLDENEATEVSLDEYETVPKFVLAVTLCVSPIRIVLE